MDKIIAFSKDHKIVTGLIAFTLLGLVLMPLTTPAEQQSTDVEESAIATEPEQKADILEYEIISEEDLSYAGCTRVAYRVVLDGNQDQGMIDATLSSIVEVKKQRWGDVTVWAYSFGEEEIAANSSYTEGIATHSTCTD